MDTQPVPLRKLRSKPVPELVYGDIINEQGDHVMGIDPAKNVRSLTRLYISNGDQMLFGSDIELPYFGNIVKRDMQPLDNAS